VRWSSTRLPAETLRLSAGADGVQDLRVAFVRVCRDVAFSIAR
jgi:hypothetical protein